MLPELFEQLRLAYGDASFCVSDGHVEFVDIAEKRAVAGGDFEAYPAIGISTVAVPCECDFGFESTFGGAGDTAAHQQSGFEDGLEAIADAEDQFVGREELTDGIVELSAKLAGEDNAGSEVITVAEATGNAEDLEIGESGGIFEQSVEVQAFGFGTCEFEGPCGFDVAVGAWGAENADFGSCHGGCTVESRKRAARRGSNRFWWDLHVGRGFFAGVAGGLSRQWESLCRG
ncbi:MAG: hypothetical protein RIT02_2031 [Planctomycetota bacterium]